MTYVGAVRAVMAEVGDRERVLVADLDDSAFADRPSGLSRREALKHLGDDS